MIRLICIIPVPPPGVLLRSFSCDRIANEVGYFTCKVSSDVTAGRQKSPSTAMHRFLWKSF